MYSNNFNFKGEARAFIFSDNDKNYHVFVTAKEAARAFHSSERASRFPHWVIAPAVPAYKPAARSGNCAAHYMKKHISTLTDEVKNKYYLYCAARADRIFQSVNGDERIFYNIVHQLVSDDFAAD